MGGIRGGDVIRYHNDHMVMVVTVKVTAWCHHDRFWQGRYAMTIQSILRHLRRLMDDFFSTVLSPPQRLVPIPVRVREQRRRR